MTHNSRLRVKRTWTGSALCADQAHVCRHLRVLFPCLHVTNGVVRRVCSVCTPYTSKCIRRRKLATAFTTCPRRGSIVYTRTLHSNIRTKTSIERSSSRDQRAGGAAAGGSFSGRGGERGRARRSWTAIAGAALICFCRPPHRWHRLPLLQSKTAELCLALHLVH